MQYRGRWEEIEGIGEGGQGKVIRVLDKRKVRLDLFTLTEAIVHMIGHRREVEVREEIRQGIARIVRAEIPVNHGALKILHSPNDARKFRGCRGAAKTRVGGYGASLSPESSEGCRF